MGRMDEAAQAEVLLNYRLAYRSESNVNWCPGYRFGKRRGERRLE